MIETFSWGDTLEGICACSFSVSQFRRASSSHSACILSQNSVSDCREKGGGGVQGVDGWEKTGWTGGGRGEEEKKED